MTDNAEWGYSTDAINVLDKFHEAHFILYVEGDDDETFWSSLLNRIGIRHYHIESAGGIQELKKIMRQITNDNANVIVACDGEYSILLDNLPKHDRIISTYGHSIENTMFCPFTINRNINS